MKIGVLTSSRADFGIYLPLLNDLKDDSFFELRLIVFGTHLSPFHGNTIYEINEKGFDDIDCIDSILLNDTESSIAASYGLTTIKFSDYWKDNKFDVVFCLGDRYEMSAAVQAGIPFGIKFAHIHGGETTLGAIDNIFRHQITLASTLHFTSTDQYAKKIIQLTGSKEWVYDIGSLSIADIDKSELIDESEFRKEFQIPDTPYILVTFHPETVDPGKNEKYAIELKKSFKSISSDYFIVVTMPNADTNGAIFRSTIKELEREIPKKIKSIENFGKNNYFAAMRYSSFLLGNSSSGIIEAASFGKFVINVGNRQKGRATSENVLDSEFTYESIMNCVNRVKKIGNYEGINVYEKSSPSSRIIEAIKNYYEII